MSARVPFPNLWSDPLSLTVDSLSLEVTITRREKPGRHSTSLSSPHLDLASSVTSAAGDFLHDELDAFEGAELDRSIRESLILTRSDPFTEDGVPGAFPPFNESGSPTAVESTTVLASLVERILSRLQLEVKNIRLRLRFEDDEHGGILELRLGSIRYADETPETSSPRRTVRAVTLSTIEVYMLPLSGTSEPTSRQSSEPTFSADLSRRSSTSSSSVSSESYSESSNDEFHSMVMSQAVANLRESKFEPNPASSTRHSMAASRKLHQSTMSSISGKSVYHSFVEEDETEVAQPPEPISERQQLADSLSSLRDPFEQPSASAGSSPDTPHVPLPQSPSTARSATPTAVPPEETLLLSFGTEDIVLRIVTSQTLPTKREWAQHDPHSPASMPRVIETPPLPMPTVDFSLTCGTIAVLLRPQHTALLLALAQSVTSKAGPGSPATPPPDTDLEANSPEFTARLTVKGVYVTLLYDLNTPSDEFEHQASQYFARPATIYPPAGHLRLKLEHIAANYVLHGSQARPSSRRKSGAVKPASMDVSVSDLSLFEYLASAESDDDEPPGGAFPVIIFDANLPKQYEVPPGAPSSLLSAQPRTPANLPNFPEFDSVDWRNAGTQRKGGERVWRVRPKGKGILRGRAASTPEQNGPAITVSKKLGVDGRKLWRGSCD